MALPNLAHNLAKDFPAFQIAAERLKEEWGTDTPPLTVALSEFGRFLIEEAADTFSQEDLNNIFSRIDQLLQNGSHAERDAVATGFLEAVATELDRFPEARWILGFIGPASRQYLTAWNQFCRRPAEFMEPNEGEVSND